MKKYFFIVTTLSAALFAEEPIAPVAEEAAGPPPSLTGEWNGRRTKLRDKGIEIIPSLIWDDTWNLHGGKKNSGKGIIEYNFDLKLWIHSEPLFHYSGGTLLAEFTCHHGRSPSHIDVGSFMHIDTIEAPPFNALYALWYKQEFQDDRYWFLVGKSDAYDSFTTTAHSLFFLNNGYSSDPTILFFPSYPDPAMSVVASIGFLKNMSVTLGVFDGSSATGADTGKHGVFGDFFKDLPAHAFLIGEFNATWLSDSYPGRFGLGGWRSTATFTRFNGSKTKGTGGPYVTIDQTFYKSKKQEAGCFFIYSSANPSISEAHRYFGAGVTGKGLVPYRENDIIGIGMSRANFTNNPAAGFTENYEASYEIFYLIQYSGWGSLQPDFQYVVNPGGKGLPNASVLTLRLTVSF